MLSRAIEQAAKVLEDYEGWRCRLVAYSVTPEGIHRVVTLWYNHQELEFEWLDDKRIAHLEEDMRYDCWNMWLVFLKFSEEGFGGWVSWEKEDRWWEFVGGVGLYLVEADIYR